MQERDIYFSLDYDRFNSFLNAGSGQNNWFALRQGFKAQEVTLSGSLLIWIRESGRGALLADMEYQKPYYLERESDEENKPVVQVSGLPEETEQLFTLVDTETMLSRLKPNPQTGYGPQGTDEGFIDFLKKIDLDQIDLDSLKRTDLSGAGFSFEIVHQDMLTVHGMLRDILTSSREWLLDLPQGTFAGVGTCLQQFYEKLAAIRDFQISGENPIETHVGLLGEISNLCDSVKGSLPQIIAYLKSKQVEKFESQLNATVAKSVEDLRTETNRTKEINDKGAAELAETQSEISRLKLELENQLRKKSISAHEQIFANQADKHQTGAWIWLGVTVILTLGFGYIFWELLKHLEPTGSQLSAILQNLFAKGFFLSLIYLLLNRSIKNYTAEKHLETINRHRQNALATFEAFAEAAGENQETRDAVLLASTDAIFEANQSGYLSTRTSRSDSANPIQQVVRAVIPNKSSDSN